MGGMGGEARWLEEGRGLGLHVVRCVEEGREVDLRAFAGGPDGRADVRAFNGLETAEGVVVRTNDALT